MKKGVKFSELHKERLKKARAKFFETGGKIWNKGNGEWSICVVCKREFYHWRVKGRVFKFCSKKCNGLGKVGDKHWNWKGDKVKYAGVHDWINKELGKPKECWQCGSKKEKRYEWANVSGKYLRITKDWKRLCSKCHHKFDDISRRGWETRKKLCKI